MVILKEPYLKENIEKLKINDIVYISGTLFTIRDMACKYLFDGNKISANLNNSIIYHAGPVVTKKNKQWIITSLGPTTSTRQEPYLWKLIESFNLKAIIGKGGMGEKTAKACIKQTCCYMSATGGAASYLADKIIKVKNIYLLDKFGSAEAVWELEVKDFPVIVTIDSYGNNLHKTIKEKSEKSLKSMGL